ncbi:hypothetical protein TNCV_5052611 [Trichonephila clavipes]|nr:hypothetical protein TNCV_5052611 [Trichonephila clavipes]
MSMRSPQAPSRFSIHSGIKRWGTSLQQNFRSRKSSENMRRTLSVPIPSSSANIRFVRRRSFPTSYLTLSMFSGVRVVFGLPVRGRLPGWSALPGNV